MSAHTSNNTNPVGNSPAARASTGARRQAPVLSGADSWRRLLAEEDQRCERTGFRAGVISIDHGPADQASTRTAAVVRVLGETLSLTDRACILNDNEIAILMMPVADTGATERLARTINTQLEQRGISAAIGFALRRDDGSGLSGASARADACAAIAHARKIRL